MELFEFKSEVELNDFLVRQRAGNILQSWAWGEILKLGKDELQRFGVRQDGRIVLAATVVKKRLLGGFSYWQISRGPILVDGLVEVKAVFSFFLEQLAANDSRAIFIRFEPTENPVNWSGDYQIIKTINLEPAETLILDLSKSEAALLSAMHPKTRYNIRLAEKKGVVVEVKEYPSETEIEDFLRLIKLTGTRDGFRLHPANHYRSLIEQGRGKIKLLFASYQGQNIAAGLFSIWHNQATYLHGASDHAWRPVMAPYLLQWTALKIAQAAGSKTYDFYGIDANKWPGVTRFKLGFGGEVLKFPGTYDAVLAPTKYQGYKLLRSFRRLIS